MLLLNILDYEASRTSLVLIVVLERERYHGRLSLSFANLPVCQFVNLSISSLFILFNCFSFDVSLFNY